MDKLFSSKSEVLVHLILFHLKVRNVCKVFVPERLVPWPCKTKKLKKKPKINTKQGKGTKFCLKQLTTNVV